MASLANPNPLFSSDVWRRALESYASAVQLTVKLFDAQGRVAFGPIHPTPLFQLFYETALYEPGIFGECARRCITHSDSRPAVIVSEFCGLSVVGTSLMLNDEIVGAAVGGYAFIDFCQVSEVQRLARDSGIGFERLWQVTREQQPVPKQRLLVHGELLQVLGDAILKENRRTRQYGAALTRSEEALRALTAQIIISQEDERRRIARELHDNLMQKLAIVENELSRLRLGSTESLDQASEELSSIEHQVANISDDVRAISHGLHPSILDDLGLEPAIRQLVRDFAERSSQPAQFRGAHVPAAIPPAIALTLYRIAQEALGNIRKHASEASVVLTLNGLPGELRLLVEDNGPGFNLNQITEAGLGLRSMQERAHLVGGRLIVTSSPGQGTSIEAIIPA